MAVGWLGGKQGGDVPQAAEGRSVVTLTVHPVVVHRDTTAVHDVGEEDVEYSLLRDIHLA